MMLNELIPTMRTIFFVAGALQHVQTIWNMGELINDLKIFC
jgi:hypothetical protein